jgi:hypothetical protein
MTRVALLAVVLFALPALADPKEHMHAPKSNSAAFAAMKKLVGSWLAQDPKGGKLSITYALTGGDRCVKEMMDMGKMGTMDTVFCDNGDHVVATHYCDSGNQPRYKSVMSKDGKSITFDFLDATGMSSPDEMHMHKLVVDLADPAKVVETWSSYEKGAEKAVTTFTLARAPAAKK